MSAMASQVTSLTIVYSTVYSRRRSKETSKLHVTGLYDGNSQVTDEFPAQRAINAENASIWWGHHVHPSAADSSYMRQVRWSFDISFSQPELTVVFRFCINIDIRI